MPARPQLLILSARYGGGHDQVAGALKDALQEEAAVEVEVLDFFQEVNGFFNTCVEWMYRTSIAHFPLAYRLFYNLSGSIDKDSWFQRQLNTVGMERWSKVLAGRSPLAVINTFPTPAGVLASLNQAGRLEAQLFTVITDHTVHSQWVHDENDYFVSCQQVADGLEARGIDRQRIQVTGIPLRLGFTNRPSRAAACQQFDLDADRPVVLFIAGSSIIPGAAAKVARSFFQLAGEAQVVVVTGRDDDLKRELQKARKRLGSAKASDVHVLGYVDQVPALMTAATLLVSKAGGITTSEALACSLPLVIVQPIPGQEEANARLLSEAGAAAYVDRPEHAAQTVAALLGDTSRLQSMRTAAAQLGHPGAARTVAKHVLRQLDLVGESD